MKRIIYLVALLAVPFLLFAAIRASIALACLHLESRYPSPGKMIPVEGHRLHLYCIGDGTPTVVIEPGMGTDWVSWRFVSRKVAGITRVCVYDRAGYGWSEPGPKPRTAGRIANELHALLSNANIGGPYLLVAHSFGGYVAQIYASHFAESLEGVILVDPSHPDETGASSAPFSHTGGSRLLSLVPPLGWQRLKLLYRGERALSPELRDLPPAYRDRLLVTSSVEQLNSERSEFESLSMSEAEWRAAPFPRNMRLTVITAARRASPAHRELQARLARLSTFGKQVLAENSGHSIQLSEPELIVNAILELIH